MNFPNNTWSQRLQDEFQKDYFREMGEKICEERKTHVIYPPENLVFSAFSFTDYDDVKVVILGQDPYHEPNQAHGLAFSVQKGVETPPSLKNMYKELAEEMQFQIPDHGYLKRWADQGVFLLNTVLTVREHEANSHAKYGWKIFTDRVIAELGKREEPMVFLLWGKQAQEKKKYITNPNHLVLEAAHPSPLSAYRGFFGCKHFLEANAFLEAHGMDPVDWQI